MRLASLEISKDRSNKIAYAHQCALVGVREVR